MSAPNRYGLIIAACSLGGIAAVGCSLAPNEEYVRLRIGLPGPQPQAGLLSGPSPDALAPSAWMRGPGPSALLNPASVDDFDCFAVNVFGPGIPRSPWDMSSPECPYRGVTSTVASRADETITLKVPSGPSRTIQMIGVATGRGCPSGATLQDIEQLYYQPNPSPSSPPSLQLVEVGRAVSDLYRDSRVEITNTFHPSASSWGYGYPFGCQPSPGPSGGPFGPELLALMDASLADETNPSSPMASALSPLTLTSPTATMLTDPSNSVPITVGTATGSVVQQRVDFRFSMAGHDLSRFGRVMIEVSANGGYYPSACGGTPPASGLGYTAFVSNGVSGWLTVGTTSVGGSAQYLSSTFGSPSTLQVFDGSSYYLRVALLSNSPAAAGCSGLSTYFVRATLMP